MIRRLVAARGGGVLGQAVRYVLASLVALALDAGLFVGLKELGMHVYPAYACGLVAGAFLGYWLCLVWVFAGRRIERHHRAFLVFLLIGVAGLGINLLVFWLVRDPLALPVLAGLDRRGHLGDLLCKGTAAVASFAWNFWLRKLVLFR